MTARRRVGILISGGGSNMAALISAMKQPDFPAEPALVISNNADAGGLAKADAAGVQTKVLDHRPFNGDRAAYDATIDAAWQDADVDLIAQAGFMRIHDSAYVEKWIGRMLNIHPSILPAFKGLKTHARALEAGCAVHGCTVHEVVPELDSGRILGQSVVPVRADDTPGTLAARVLVQEHRLYPAVLRAFAEDPDTARRTPISMLGAA
ncbi:MAG: phosphoribosylglycinamide formyltransferase [Pseudomonadota bacterium]